MLVMCPVESETLSFSKRTMLVCVLLLNLMLHLLVGHHLLYKCIFYSILKDHYNMKSEWYHEVMKECCHRDPHDGLKHSPRHTLYCRAINKLQLSS